MKNKVVIISGPTGVGKTELSLEFAKTLNGEIISADSVQVYKGLDIGSAKIMPDQMKGIKHHLIDCLEMEQDFGVDIFVKMANAAIQDITAREKLPIIVGGTAFYIQALLKGISFDEEQQHDFGYRDELEKESIDKLFIKLSNIDPEYAAITHKNNKKRVIRALEYYHFTGEKFSVYNKRQSLRESVYDYKYFVLDDERENIYKKCDTRVDLMMKAGLYDEAFNIYNKGYSRELTSMQGIGYRELFDCFDGKCSLEEAVMNIKKNTRHYVKRQMTWFRRENNVIFINKSDFKYNDSEILNYMIKECKNDFGEMK